MNLHNKNIKTVLSIMRIIETAYLIVSFVLFYFRNIPQDTFQAFVQDWVYFSYFILPLLLLKNLIVAMFNKTVLTHKQKNWLLIRCVLYVILSFLAYPIVVSL